MPAIIGEAFSIANDARNRFTVIQTGADELSLEVMLDGVANAAQLNPESVENLHDFLADWLDLRSMRSTHIDDTPKAKGLPTEDELTKFEREVDEYLQCVESFKQLFGANKRPPQKGARP
jgi:hypothetical protein